MPTFGHPGFAYTYLSPTTGNRKFLARAEHSYFVGMESDERLCRVSNQRSNRVDIARFADFRPCTEKHIPSMTTPLVGLSWPRSYDNITDPDSHGDKVFLRASNLLSNVSNGNLTDPQLPETFNDAITLPDWCNAINREYRALRQCNT